MSRHPDLHRALIAALEQRLGPLDDLASVARPWSSVTFAGARHVLSFRTEPAHRAALSGIAEADLPMAGHFVADIVVVAANERRTKIEALTIETA